MYDIDWLAPFEPPKKKRGRPKGSTKPRKPEPKRPIKMPPEGGRGNRSYGRPKGSSNSPEVRARIGQTNSDNSWRRHSPNKGSAPLQSGSGLGEADYSLSYIGRVYPRFNRDDTEWN